MLRRKSEYGSPMFIDDGACHPESVRSMVINNQTNKPVPPVHGTAFVRWNDTGLQNYSNYLFYRSFVIDFDILKNSATKLTPFLQQLKNNDTK